MVPQTCYCALDLEPSKLTLPIPAFNQVSTETALITDIATTASLAGWSTFGPASTTPAGSVWFQSSGSSGDDNIVGGLLDNGARQIQGYTAADLDTHAIVSASVGGYVNSDPANTTATKVSSSTSVSNWPVRNIGATITYLIVVSRDSINVLCTYLTAGAKHAQCVIHIGHPEPVNGHGVQNVAYAKLLSIDASTPATTIITLDRNITIALKDRSVFTTDYIQAPMFISVATAGMSNTDFALAQRIPILDNSLSTISGKTTFQINATVASKLTGSPGGTPSRYRSGRGVGDIVRLDARPNLCYAFGDGSGSSVSKGGHGCIASWDAFGGQRAGLQCLSGRRELTPATLANVHPAIETNRWVTYRLSSILTDKETTMLPQTDNQGMKNVGCLRGIIESSYINGQISDFDILTLDLQRGLRYRTLGVKAAGDGLSGISSSALDLSPNKTMAIGPGW